MRDDVKNSDVLLSAGSKVDGLKKVSGSEAESVAENNGDATEEYRELVYSLFALCFSVVTGEVKEMKIKTLRR